MYINITYRVDVVGNIINGKEVKLVLGEGYTKE